MNKKLIFNCKKSCLLTQELKSLYDSAYLNDDDVIAMNFDKNNCCGMVLDCSLYKNKKYEFKTIVNHCNCNNIPIVLLNVDDTLPVSECLGFSIPSQCMIFRKYNSYKVFDIIGNEDRRDLFTRSDDFIPSKNNPYYNETPKSLYKDYVVTCCSCNNFSNCCMCSSNNCSTCTNDTNPRLSNPENNYKVMASKIQGVLSSDYVLPSNSILNKRSQQPLVNRANISPTTDITSLPEAQYKVMYVNLDLEEPISETETQVVSNYTTLEISLIASYDPKYKYLHLRTLGSGLNPGQLLCNTSCCRKWFQNTINISAKPSNENLNILSVQPQNINNQTRYEAYSVIRVGVNVSIFPGFLASYQVTSTETSTISDFTITNNTFLNEAKWQWQLSYTKDDVSNIFSGAVFRNAYIRKLPPLAVSNLQPSTDTVWYIDNTFNDTVTLRVRFNVQYLSALIIPNAVFRRRFFSTKEVYDIDKFYSKRISIDFSSVYA